MEAGSGVDSAAKRSLLADSDHDPGNGVTKNLLLNNWVEQVQGLKTGLNEVYSHKSITRPQHA